MLGFCLTLGTESAWAGFCALAAVRLEMDERAALAFASLGSLPLPQAETVARVLFGAAGAPVPSFLGGMNEARSWAAMATEAELKCYAAAAYDAMSRANQIAFDRRNSEVEF